MNENRIVVKTGKAKRTWHSPFRVSQMIGDSKAPVAEGQILDIISNMDAVLRGGDECLCILEEGKLVWCNGESSSLPIDLTDDDFTDIEVNDKAHDMWKKERVEKLIGSMQDCDLDILKEHFNTKGR